MSVVKHAADLGELAQRENLVFIAVSKPILEGLRGQFVEIVRFDDDPRHPRLRQIVVRSANR